MLKVGVIGVGSMGQNHARVYFNSDNAALVAVADAHHENLDKISRKYNVLGFSDYHEIFPHVEAVSIAVPTSLHHQVALAALHQQKHVLLEKPIASTEQEAQEIIAAAKKNKVKLMIGHIERFNPAISELKRRLERGDLGEIYKIDVQRIGPFPSRITDVGVIIDLSVHDLDIISHLINSQPQRLYAEVQQKLHPHCEDSVTALVRYKNDVLAILNINYLSPTKTRQLQVFGKKGMFSIDYLNQELYFYENKSFSSETWESVTEGDMKKITLPKKEPLQLEIDAFLNCIQQQSESPVNGEQGLEVLRIANLLLRSARESRIIEI